MSQRQVPCRNNQYISNICSKPGAQCKFNVDNIRTDDRCNITSYVEQVKVSMPATTYTSSNGQCPPSSNPVVGGYRTREKRQNTLY